MRLVIAAVAWVTAAAAQGMPTVPAIDDPAFQKGILDVHNAERRAVAVPDLVWSPALAKDAKRWADKIAKEGVLKHERQSKHGENLWMNGIGRYAPAQMAGGWIAEKPRYKPGYPMPKFSTTGNWADVGHYTAVVWATTTEIGCAVARGKQYDVLVCRYNPPGNVEGYTAYDAGKAKAAADAAAAAAKAKAKEGPPKK